MKFAPATLHDVKALKKMQLLADASTSDVLSYPVHSLLGYDCVLFL